MRQTIIGFVLLGVVIIGASLAFSQKGGERRGGEGVLSVLAKGQPVSVKDVSGRYEIGVMPNAEMLGYKVVAVGSDYLALQDITGATELRIPIYSISSVSTLKAGQ